MWEDGHELYAREADLVYDLASLTKPLCTAELAMRHVAAGRLDLDAGHPLLPAGVTVAHLLQHCAGWPAWQPYHERFTGRDALYGAALSEPLVNPPGAVHTYSDIGFLALGAVIEALAGPIEAQWTGPLRWGDARSEPTDGERGGPVHDPNARAMGGIAPHAGLFGSAREVASTAARWLDGDVPLAALAWSRKGAGSHVLGWDTPNPDGTSTAGSAPPPGAVGHLGFTGTSLWISPSTRRIAVLLTNRVAYGPDLTGVRALRRAFHQAAWDLRRAAR